MATAISWKFILKTEELDLTLRDKIIIGNVFIIGRKIDIEYVNLHWNNKDIWPKLIAMLMKTVVISWMYIQYMIIIVKTYCAALFR